MSLVYEFLTGESVRIDSLDLVCNIDGELGSGTQGKVYSIICPDNSSLVLKWYFPSMSSPEQLEILEQLISKQTPSDRFLWPLTIVKIPGKEGFGYVMLLKESRFKSFSLWLSRKVEPSFNSLLTACFELAQSFHFLHSMGLCYRDLSLNNIYFDPKTGEIRIGDTDNIVVNGENKGSVIGTPKFMAPEIITGKSLPDTQSDLFSLAVILFYILFLNHPLEGKKESSIKSLDLPAMAKLYGSEPLFIFDPHDDSNYPDPIFHKNALIFWNIYPKFFKNYFIRAFTHGIRDPLHGRVRETEWQNAICMLKDLICYCSNCGQENFFIPSELMEFEIKDVKKEDASPLGNIKSAKLCNSDILDNHIIQYCWNQRCRTKIQRQFYLKINNKTIVVLNHNTKLYLHHVNPAKKYDFSNPVAEISKHPLNPDIWGLKNLSNSVWSVTNNNNVTLEVGYGKSVKLNIGIIIDFGNAIGNVCY